MYNILFADKIGGLCGELSKLVLVGSYVEALKLDEIQRLLGKDAEARSTNFTISEFYKSSFEKYLQVINFNLWHFKDIKHRLYIIYKF